MRGRRKNKEKMNKNNKVFRFRNLNYFPCSNCTRKDAVLELRNGKIGYNYYFLEKVYAVSTETIFLGSCAPDTHSSPVK